MALTYVIFGASGDLTSRKLIPALYQLHRKGRLPEGTKIVGAARTTYTDESFREYLRAGTEEFSDGEFSEEVWQAFTQRIYYQPNDITRDDEFVTLAKRLGEIEGGQPADRVYYLSTAPQFYGPAVEQLGKSGMAKEGNGARRVVIEKPFGIDLVSAQKLNEVVHKVFKERQVYRIDHYLGKETVQNLLVLRFANAIFEPLWNRRYIDHVQITAAEEVTVGRRAGYYNGAGVLRDMFQNHLLQLLMVTAMESPNKFEADAVRNEKVKVLQAIRTPTPEDIAQSTLRGQYKGYLQEPGVPAGSTTATFATTRFWIDNWRWQGVPFYLRSGKAMSCRTTQIVVQFREPPHLMFGKSGGLTGANKLVIQVQPCEGIQLHVQTKVPDQGMKLRMSNLDFSFRAGGAAALPEAYQRLLQDTIIGDASLFARHDEVETAWSIIDPILHSWDAAQQPPLLTYEPGFWGPEESTAWMEKQGREWFDLCPVLR